VTAVERWVKSEVLKAGCLKCAYSDRGEESRSGRAQIQVPV